jgi:hypothetical protein
MEACSIHPIFTAYISAGKRYSAAKRIRSGIYKRLLPRLWRKNKIQKGTVVECEFCGSYLSQ